MILNPPNVQTLSVFLFIFLKLWTSTAGTWSTCSTTRSTARTWTAWTDWLCAEANRLPSACISVLEPSSRESPLWTLWQKQVLPLQIFFKKPKIFKGDTVNWESGGMCVFPSVCCLLAGFRSCCVSLLTFHSLPFVIWTRRRGNSLFPMLVEKGSK